MAFGYYTAFTVQASQITGTLTNFPTLVTATDARFKSVANSGHVQSGSGYDLIPHSDVGLTTRLKFERLSYNAATGAFMDFVKIPSAAVGSVIYYGYGDASITTDQSDAVNVWTAATSMWHLPDGSSLTALDSTGLNNGTLVNTPTATTGKVDGGANFVRSSAQRITIASHASLAPTSISLCAWLVHNGGGPVQHIFSRDDGGSNRIWQFRQSSIAALDFIAFHTNGSLAAATSAVMSSTGSWYRVWGTFDGTTVRTYVNGAADGTGSVSGALNTGTATATIGGNVADVADTNWWDGKLDEVGLFPTAVSADWIAADYKNQNDQATWWGSLATEQAFSGGGDTRARLIGGDLFDAPIIGGSLIQ